MKSSSESITKINQSTTTMISSPKTIDDPEQLLQYGICRVKLPAHIDWKGWAAKLSQVKLDNMGFEGDGEYAFYRNIMDEPDFPFQEILQSESIGAAMVKYFDIQSVDDELRLDDAFCVHYNMSQHDTSGAKHTDPSDITVNMCLEKQADTTTGSQVMFYGTRSLTTTTTSNTADDDDGDDNDSRQGDDFCFLVNQEEGYATLHWGEHPHETLPLQSGKRTNIVLTLLYKDKSRSKAGSRTCYQQ